VQGQAEQCAAQREPDREGQGHADQEEGEDSGEWVFPGEREGKLIVGTSLSHQHQRVRDRLELPGDFVIRSLRPPCGRGSERPGWTRSPS